MELGMDVGVTAIAEMMVENGGRYGGYSDFLK